MTKMYSIINCTSYCFWPTHFMVTFAKEENYTLLGLGVQTPLTLNGYRPSVEQPNIIFFPEMFRRQNELKLCCRCFNNPLVVIITALFIIQFLRNYRELYIRRILNLVYILPLIPSGLNSNVIKVSQSI